MYEKLFYLHLKLQIVPRTNTVKTVLRVLRMEVLIRAHAQRDGKVQIVKTEVKICYSEKQPTLIISHN